MENDPVLFQVDSETVNDLARVVDALTKYLQWLIEKKDLEAVNKLSPIVKRMSDLMLAILEGNNPEIGGAIDAINQTGDEINERLAQATTPEELDQLSNEVDKEMQKVHEVMDKGLAEISKREETAKKEKKH